ncbi:IS5 family transposase [Streptomyces pristinaespiralis]|uniref:Transposase n=2 Tax=Streptomyces pristinaespiralis TaxID=38300 RepID=B5H5Z9_STRE2|nr:IS5 family transposase [Streptomyces pristinaespiralis]ALC22124.1 transposase [Streptomyces pristinaespiralis]EDY62260.1 transposase [Streptomyces pristinaespiralis ATCC 25486]QMU15233.1 IS5 family transposase [Streptomyces pristinaespiralis]
MPRKQRPYPSDLSDARWKLLEPTLTAWRAERRGKSLDIGQPPEHDLRRIMDAILYVDRTGIPWRYLPHDFPPWETVYGYFAAWQKDEVFDQLNGLLRRLVRKAEGRDVEPSACVLDAQSIKTSANVPAAGQGIDAGKKIAGRKRHIGVDTLGLLLAVLVTAASVSDNAGGIHVLSNIAADHPRITKAWADTGYRTKVIDHGARLGIDVEVTRRDPAQKGFKVIPRRWVVERTFGWLMHHRRLVRDYETHPHRSEAMIKVAMVDLMSRRLTRESTPNWKDS